MHIKGGEALAVVDHHQSAFVEKISGQQHASVADGGDGCAHGRMEIQPMVRALEHPVEFALDPKTVGRRGSHRLAEISRPQTLGADRGKGFVFDLLLVLDASGRRRVRRSRKLLRNAQRNRRIGDMPHHYLRSQRSEEHTSELQSRSDLVCRLLLEKKKKKKNK